MAQTLPYVLSLFDIGVVLNVTITPMKAAERLLASRIKNPDTPRVRWGVLGSSRFARGCVLPAIVASTNSEFAALASRKESKLGEIRRQYPSIRVYGDYEDLLNDQQVDAVYLPLPNSLHCEWAVKAAQHGKHVLCEKPMALTAEEGQRMAAACAQARVHLMEAFMYRYSHRTKTIIDIVRRGVLGNIRQVSATFRVSLTDPTSTRLQASLGGGALYDVGSYALNLIGLIADLAFGARPGTAIPQSLAVESEYSGGVDVSLSALLGYAGGLTAVLHCGFTGPKWLSVEIVGDKGVLVVPDTFLPNAGSMTLITGQDQQSIPMPACDCYQLEIEDFARAIRSGNPPLVGVAESLRNASITDRLLSVARLHCLTPTSC